MKTKLIISLYSIAFLFMACAQDKKQVDVSEMGDTSFVNNNFESNLIDYRDGMSACDQLNTADIAKLYGVSASQIVLDDPLTNPNRQATSTPICSFYVESGASDFLWLKGSISVNREIGKDEHMGEVHEATGGGENWEEAWALQKSMSKSSEWVDGLGLAALWKASANELKIRFKGYTLNIYPPTNRANQEEAAQNRDYKDVAIKIAKAAGYVN